MFRVLAYSLAIGLLSLNCLSQSGLAQSASAPSPTSPVAGQAAGPSSPAKVAEVAAASSASPAASAIPSSPLEAALLLYRKGDFTGALAKYQELLKDHPQSPDAYAGMVRVYLKQKKVDEAAKAADEGFAHSDHPRLRSARAEVWFRQGRITDAERDWVQVVNSYPEAHAYLGLARVRNAIAMYKSAKQMIDKAHEIDPDDPDIQNEWIYTLPRAERIEKLETSLAGDNNWDPDERSHVADYLHYLKERSKQKSTSPCRLVSKVTKTETPMVSLMRDPEHLRGYGLDVHLNGHKSSLLLDTGASGIVVKRSIAEHAGISKISETKLWGIGDKGSRKAYVGIADSIKVGDLEFQNCPVEVMESYSVAGEDGLIGADVFEDFLVDLDFPNKKLKLTDLPKRPGEAEPNLTLKSEENDSDDADTPEPAKSEEAKSTGAQTASPPAAGLQNRYQDRFIAPEMQSYTHIFRFGHQLLVPTTIGDAPSKLFVMDSGALFNAISPAAAREVTKVQGNSFWTVKGISGKVEKVYMADKTVLAFGHVRQWNQDLTSFDTTRLSDSVGTEVSGFLGFILLRFVDIKIDYRDALVDFK